MVNFFPSPPLRGYQFSRLQDDEMFGDRLGRHRAGSKNGATTQESPSRARRMSVMNGKSMVNSRYRFLGQTLKCLTSGKS
jgi:hypothetical protein